MPTEAREQHLELAIGAVLRLVDQHEAVVQRAAAHEGHWRDLDRAVVQRAAQALGSHAVVQRVPQGAQIGIELLAHVARQEAEVLAGFHGRTGQENARNGAGLEGFDGGADRQIGLAGAGGADGDGERLAFYGLHQEALVIAARPYFSNVALISVVRCRSPVEDQAVDTIAVTTVILDGVQFGAACSAFCHFWTPETV